MTAQEVRSAADALDVAEMDRTQIGLLSETHPSMDMDDAYAVQGQWISTKRARGERVVGWKIGLTSKAMQSALGIDIPDSGVLLESMVFPDGATVPAGRFIQPRVEAEIAFVMRTSLSGEGMTRRDVLAATDYVAPALEILDTRIVRKSVHTGRMRTVLDTIADNAANAGVILGQPSELGAMDLRWVGAIVSRDGSVEETGLGAGVLDDPALAVAWLANRLAAYGERIEAGQIVLSGSFVRPVEAPPGRRVTADFGSLGLVSCNFD